MFINYNIARISLLVVRRSSFLCSRCASPARVLELMLWLTLLTLICTGVLSSQLSVLKRRPFNWAALSSQWWSKTPMPLVNKLPAANASAGDWGCLLFPIGVLSAVVRDYRSTVQHPPGKSFSGTEGFFFLESMVSSSLKTSWFSLGLSFPVKDKMLDNFIMPSFPAHSWGAIFGPLCFLLQ